MGDERRLRELREEQARLEAAEPTDEVTVKLMALREDIRMATADLDDAIAQAQERARRLEGDHPAP